MIEKHWHPSSVTISLKIQLQSWKFWWQLWLLWVYLLGLTPLPHSVVQLVVTWSKFYFNNSSWFSGVCLPGLIDQIDQTSIVVGTSKLLLNLWKISFVETIPSLTYLKMFWDLRNVGDSYSLILSPIISILPSFSLFALNSFKNFVKCVEL